MVAVKSNLLYPPSELGSELLQSSIALKKSDALEFNSNPMMGVFQISLFIIFFNLILLSNAEPETDTLLQGNHLKDGNHLVSSGKVFELKFFTSISKKRKGIGYFSPDLLHNRYLGIFYKDSDYDRPVWIANRDNPIPNKSGSLMIGNDCELKILEGNSTSILLSSSMEKKACSVVLIDTGNLVLLELNSDGSKGNILWQSFDYPTDTLLPGMKLGFRSGESWNLTSWVSDEVPATGTFTLGADPNGTGQIMIWRRGEVYWKSGIWGNRRFENFQDYTYNFEYDQSNGLFLLSFVHDWRITSPVFMINELGTLRKSDPEYPLNSSLRMTSLVDCHHFSPGCVSSKLPDCHRKASVEMMLGFRVSDGLKYRQNHSWSIADCEALCLSKCSCVGFASLYHNGTACELWTDRSQITFDNEGYREIYVLFDRPLGESLWLRTITGALIFLFILSMACICCFNFKVGKMNANLVLNQLFYLMQRRIRAIGKRSTEEETSFVELGTSSSHSGKFRRKRHLKILYYKSHGLQLFTFQVLFQATDGFSPSNELGQGGFGIVYKGKLPSGEEIAIKRLSRSSRQGLTEFKNELKVLAKLQHTNLVKIVGCCVEQGEKIIVYEYMPNRSLDFYLSDPDRKVHLDWKKRFHIIEGITQGLIYLHKYSRLKIIHRDLKAANILLDKDMNAKISDFGMARIFGPDESQANTHKIAGTYGYMPPEYVTVGNYSEKSDVFSFGVLLIEIVCGKKNNASYSPDRTLNLVGYAWELWMDNRGFELIDEALDYGLCEKKQAMRCIHVGLLCTQAEPVARPSMAEAVAMIGNEWIELEPPNRPAFLFGRNPNPMIKPDLCWDDDERQTFNDVSITDMVAR